MKLALAMICKATDEEAELLGRCLASAAPHFDGLFVTITGENQKCEEVCKLFGATASRFDWIHDFAAARNFSFAQVPKDYDYIGWCDADDTLFNFEKLRPAMEAKPVDTYSMFYIYSRDQHGNPDNVHTKVRIVRNDGCVRWEGAIHEEFTEQRAITSEFIEDCKVVHGSNPERFEAATQRNLMIAEEAYAKSPNDRIACWNYAKSLIGAGRHADGISAFENFLKLQLPEVERYTALIYMGRSWQDLGETDKALGCIQQAIGLLPDFPDAYHAAGDVARMADRLNKAIEYYIAGLSKKVQYLKVIVYSPREYDYKPLVHLGHCFYGVNRPDQALICFRKALEIQPGDKQLAKLTKLLERESSRFDKVVAEVKRLESLGNKERLRKRLEKLSPTVRSHPSICFIANRNFIKETSTGRDISYYCSHTDEVWTPETARTKGIGGSEEHVIAVTKRWAAAGWNVTVYNNCGTKPLEFDGVTYKPFWMFNHRDKTDVLVVWRHPRILDYEQGARKVLVDLHDVVPPGEFTAERLKRIDKVLVKTKFHRSLFPDIPDDKIAVIGNGIEWSRFQGGDVNRDPYLLINTSSPDRSLTGLLDCFDEVRKHVPQARLKWAYGWGVFDSAYSDDAEKMAWKKSLVKRLKETPGVEVLGRLGHDEIIKLYQEASVFAYPSDFAEIFCISAVKAVAAGAIPIITNFSATPEVCGPYAKLVHTPVGKDTWAPPGMFDFSLKDKAAKEAWVSQCVEVLRRPPLEREDQRQWSKRWDWDAIAASWMELFK